MNEYFNGNVKSLALETVEGKATVGVILPGEYEFGTATKEIMHIVAGSLEVLLPDSNTWELFTSGKKFIVESGKKFKVKTTTEMAYLCEYR